MSKENVKNKEKFSLLNKLQNNKLFSVWLLFLFDVLIFSFFNWINLFNNLTWLLNQSSFYYILLTLFNAYILYNIFKDYLNEDVFKNKYEKEIKENPNFEEYLSWARIFFIVFIWFSTIISVVSNYNIHDRKIWNEIVSKFENLEKIEIPMSENEYINTIKRLEKIKSSLKNTEDIKNIEIEINNLRKNLNKLYP